MEATSIKTTKQTLRWQLLRFFPLICGCVVFIILPAFLDPYLQSLMTKVVIFAMFAASLDLILGYTGLWHFGHAAFFGMGGYAAGKLAVHYNIGSFWISAPFGILMATFTAAIFGLIALRLTKLYFLLVTLALGQLLYNMALKWKWLETWRNAGILGITRPDLGIPQFTWNGTSFYYFVLLIVIVCFFLLYRIVNSPFGLALQGIREDDVRMKCLGYNVWMHRYVSFILGGLFAGVSGVLFAYHNGMVIPEHFGISTSVIAILMVIIGGTGTLFGPVIGAILLIFLEHWVSMITSERWPIILGAAFIVSAMYARGGIFVHVLRLWNKAKYKYENVAG